MRRTGLRVLLATAVALAVPNVSWGWGKEGHEVVGKIANRFLTPTARQAVHELLQGNQFRSIGDGGLANWADSIRGSAAMRQKYPNNGQWHFIDVPVTADLNGLDLSAFCSNGDCVIGALKKMRDTLRSPDASETDRRQALFFIVHFVGDLHQPLHCAERDGDRGGNLCRVNLPGDGRHVTNLHKVWDTDLIHHDMGDLTVADYAARLGELISLETKAKFQQGSVEDWALDSHKLARNVAYPGVPKQDAPVSLNNGYVDKGAEAVRLQLIKGGVRLAAFLNETFTD